MRKIKNRVMYVIILVLVIMIIEKMQKKTEYMKMEAIYYKALLKKEDDTRQFRHDINEHLLYINSMIEKTGNKQWIKYMGSLLGEMQNIRTSVYELGNEIANVLINYYLGQIEERVKIKISGVWTKADAINKNDLCAIIGNLMKNSVKAIKEDEGENKYLNIELLEEKDEIKMIVKNSCQNSDITIGKDMLPQTTKSDKKIHGIGMKNTKRLVEKNNGIFKWKCEDGCFSVMFTMKKTI